MEACLMGARGGGWNRPFFVLGYGVDLSGNEKHIVLCI